MHTQTNTSQSRSARYLIAGLMVLMLVATACGTDDTTETVEPETTVATAASEEATETAESNVTEESVVATTEMAVSCEDIAAQFSTKGSANADLADPVSSAVCDGDTVVVTANGIPDYTYIETSPGSPTANEKTYTIPATPTVADTVTAVPLLGEMAVATNGVPIYGPTEGQGGDVYSLEGALNECGSHNGPTGFHMHIFGTSETTDCMFTAEEAAAGPQLIGYAFDGFPIYSGNDQYTSSWELTDESLFATDTWAAHTYVEGSGDLDECNGLTDADGNYAYYTTDSFPYVMGCYTGDV